MSNLKTGVPWSSQAIGLAVDQAGAAGKPRDSIRTPSNHLGRTYPQELRLEIFVAAR